MSSQAGFPTEKHILRIRTQIERDSESLVTLHSYSRKKHMRKLPHIPGKVLYITLIRFS